MVHIHRDFLKPEEKKLGPHGWAFLGRDAKTWGEDIGLVSIDPDYETRDGIPHYNDKEFDALHDKIHLSIASFRDVLCPRTLYNLFHKASNPKRIYVRIVQQIEPNSPDKDDGHCWKGYCEEYNKDCEEYQSQVKVWTMNAKIAKGPTDPRSKLSKLVEHDYIAPTPLLTSVAPRDYCLQTDSHMDFTQDFDSLLIEMFHRTKNDYAVLSTYVAPLKDTDNFPKDVPHLCMVTYTSTWRNWGTKLCKSLLRPKMTNVAWGAGLSFSKCHADLNVPVDPFLPNIFDGEELSRGFRFFTHGYDMYTPDQVLVTHDYDGHQHNPHVHTWGRKHHDGVPVDFSQDEELTNVMARIQKFKPEPVGVARINVMMGIIADHENKELINGCRYGIGTRRTLNQAIEFSGFDPQKRKMVSNNCGNLAWVPFEEIDNNFGLSTNLNRPIWDEGQHAAQMQKDVWGRNNANPSALAAVVAVCVLVVMVLKRKPIYRRLCMHRKAERLVL